MGICNKDCFNCIYDDCILPDSAPPTESVEIDKAIIESKKAEELRKRREYHKIWYEQKGGREYQRQYYINHVRDDEQKQRNREKQRERNKWLYDHDPEYRLKILERNRLYNKKRYEKRKALKKSQSPGQDERDKKVCV